MSCASILTLAACGNPDPTSIAAEGDIGMDRLDDVELPVSAAVSSITLVAESPATDVPRTTAAPSMVTIELDGCQDRDLSLVEGYQSLDITELSVATIVAKDSGIAIVAAAPEGLVAGGCILSERQYFVSGSGIVAASPVGNGVVVTLAYSDRDVDAADWFSEKSIMARATEGEFQALAIVIAPEDSVEAAPDGVRRAIESARAGTTLFGGMTLP